MSGRLGWFGVLMLVMASGYSMFGWWGIPVVAVIALKAKADHDREMRSRPE